jgi:hypothetical protein
MSNLATNQQAELEKAVTRVVYFAEFDFLSGKIRLNSSNSNIDWGGYTWQGLGSLGSISSVDEADSTEAKSLTFTLNCADSGWVALAIGSDDQYRGRAAKLYFSPLAENFSMVGTPVVCWSGVMDMMLMSIDNDSGSISLKCESSIFRLKRGEPYRLNAAQHKREWPTDKGLDYLISTQTDPVVWLSANFQKK